MPSTVIVPLSGSSSALMQRSIVDLPDHLFAAMHIKVDALENFQVSEVLVQPADADHDVFVAHLSSPLPRRFSSMWMSQAKPSVATQYIKEIVRYGSQ